MLGIKQRGIKYHFLVFGMTRPGIEPQFPVPLASTLRYFTCFKIDLFSLEHHAIMKNYFIGEN